MKGARPRSAGARAEATRGPRRPAEPPARSRSMTMTRWSNGAEGRRRGDSLWTLRSDGTGKKAKTATRGSLLVDGSHAGQRQQNRCANSFLRPALNAGSRTTRAIIPRAKNRVLPWSQCANDAGARVTPNGSRVPSSSHLLPMGSFVLRHRAVAQGNMPQKGGGIPYTYFMK
mgnify:FL=1